MSAPMQIPPAVGTTAPGVGAPPAAPVTGQQPATMTSLQHQQQQAAAQQQQGGVKRSHQDMEAATTATTPAPVALPSQPTIVGTALASPTGTSAASTASAPVVAGGVSQPPQKKPNLGPTAVVSGGVTPTAVAQPMTTQPPQPNPALGGPTQSTRFPQGVNYTTGAVPSVLPPQGQPAPPVQQQPPTQPPPPPPQAAPLPKVQDALGYLEKVKQRFSSQPVVYNQFLDIMKDFKSQTIDTEGVIRRVKNLFKGNRSLILGFNQFLPPGYRIELEPEAPPPPPPKTSRPTIEFKQAMEYVAKIKTRFREEPAIYAEFLEILHDYQAKRTIDEVYSRVQRLFSGQPDLLDEFKYFLPESAVQGHARQQQATQQKKTTAQPTNFNRPQQSTAQKPGQQQQGQQKKPQPGQQQQGKPQLDSKGRPIPKGQPLPMPAGGDRRGKDAQGRPIQIGKDGKPIKTGVPQGPSGQRHEPGKDVGKDGHRHEHRHHHHHSSTAGAAHAPRVTYPPGSEKELALFERMKNHSSKAQWIQFLKALNLFANDLISRGELIRMVEDIYGERSGSSGTSDWVEKFKQTIGYDETEEKQVAALNQTNYYAFVSSVDFTVCHQVTPSYRELPQLIQVPHSSGRSAIADEVLNDTCISIPTGSEDFSFKSTRKNIYEENLFKCEDERFELDMLIENNAAAIRVLDPIVESLPGMAPEQVKRLRLPDTVDILHIRAIARVYGEQGYEMVEALNKSPAIATPIILTRLKQKDLEWRKIRNEMKSTWRKVNEQNYQRSLDHRSFYFKQEDKKRRSPKALVVELKEVHQAVFGSSTTPPVKVEPVASTTRIQQDATGKTTEKKVLPLLGSEDLTGEESLMLRAIKQGQPPNPLYSYCMRFKYGDEGIHAQLFDIVAKVGSLILSSEIDQLKLLMFFATFVGQFFGQPLTEAQEAKLAEKGERVAAEEERRLRERDSADIMMDEKEKTANEANILGALMNNNEAHPSAADEEDETREDVEDDSDHAKGVNASLAAPAAPAAGGARSKSKKKAGKKKSTGKKKPLVGAAAVKPSMTPLPTKEDEDGDDEDDKEEKKEDEDVDESGSSARQRAAHAAAQALNQLAAVKTLMAKIRAANEINAEGATPATASGTPIRPVKLHLDSPWLADDKPSPTNPQLRKHGRPSHLFLGSHAYYVFFRLHQFAYERLLTAKTLAHKARRNSSKKKLPVTAEERHDRFKLILDQLLEDKLETSKFEDECRNLLGASSYVLFTIDKLIEQLVKQTCQLLSSDNGLKVLSLYQYENRRVRTCLAAARKANNNTVPTDQLVTLARQYQSNISNLLGDDSACAIEYFDDSHELAIGLTENLDANNRHLPGDEWNQFVEEYLGEIPPVALRTPFRRRNLRFAHRAWLKVATAGLTGKAKMKSEKETEAAIQAQAMKHVYQKMQLASKLDLRSFKLHFIEHTTDIFVRAAGKTNAKKIAAAKPKKELLQKKFTKYQTWLAKRLSDLAPLAAQQSAAGLMLGFGGDDGGEGTGMDVDEDAAMDTSDAPADDVMGDLTAAADAEEEGEEEGAGEDEEEDEKMA